MEQGAPGEQEKQGNHTALGRWWRRSSIRSLRKELERPDTDLSEMWDARSNAETRLPEEESVNFGGLVLTEAFTPSTVSSLFKTLDRWPTERPGEKEERLQELARSRGGRRGGWQNLGYVRPPGTFTVGGPGSHDATLPPGIDAVWIRVSYVTPSLAMVVATFTLTEEAGDLSPILRADYRTQQHSPYFAVYGRLGALRARIPWARPLRYRAGANTSMAEDQKRQKCEALIREVETSCSRWFYGKFSGRFAAADENERPAIRMLFTKDQVPYEGGHNWLRPLGLEFAFPLWRSTENPGWWLSEDRFTRFEERSALMLTARRMDAAPRQGDGEPGTSNWSLTQRFGTHQAELAALHALPALLSVYGDRLARLRDRTRLRRHLRQPVREGLTLDDYLIGDGLDAATVASDLDAYTENLDNFRWGVPEFTEHLDHMPEPSSVHKREPREYVPVLREVIRSQAARIANDSTVTTEAVKASAELRQAISNTRLQRFTLLLSAAAAVTAVVGLLVASH